MNQADFENNFMLITAIENTSMEGLTVENVETYNDGLYISLIHYEDGETYNKNETCISYIISREMEREKIYVTRNLRNSEKDMSEEVKIEKNENINNRIYYKNEEYRRMEKEISENSKSHSFSLVPINWEDMIYRKIKIEQTMPEINFSEWENLGNDFYIKTITNYSEYLKLFNNYDLPEMSWEDFKYISIIVVLNKNLQRNIEIEDKGGTIYLGADNLNELENDEKLKYNGFFALVPNYRVLKNDLVKLRDK